MITWFLAYLKGPVFNPFKQSDGLPWLMLGIVCWVITGLFLSLAPYRSWLYGWVWLAMPTVFFIIVQIQNLKMARRKRGSAMVCIMAWISGIGHPMMP